MSWVGSYHSDLQGVRLLQPYQHAHSASGLTIHTPRQAPLPKPHQSLCHRYHSLPRSQSEPWHGDAKMMNGFFRTGNDSWRDTLPSLISKLIFHSPSSCHGHRALPWPNSPSLPDLHQDVLAFSNLSSFCSWWCMAFSVDGLLVHSSTWRILSGLMQILVKWPIQSLHLAVSRFELGMAERERQSSELPRHHV